MLTQITDTIKYVGADDPDKTRFENQYATPCGMSYNSYIVFGERIALLDTIDTACSDIWLSNVDEALDGRKPDYLVVHHMEPDHSANIRRVMELYPDMQLVTTAKAAVMVAQFFEGVDYASRTVTVGDGDEIDLGGRSLKVFTAPFMHWPEVMITYDSMDHVLFTADGFGKFGALQCEQPWTPEARRYYCNIVGKYGAQVQNVLKKLSGLEIKAIAPLHGPVLMGDLTPYLDLYKHWSTYTPECDGVLVAYASVYGGTRKAALYVADKLRERGVEVMAMDLCNCDMSEAVAQAFRLSKAVFASITYDGGLFTPMYEFMHRLTIKGWQRRRAALIENGTWAPVAARLMADMLSKMKAIDVIEPVVSLRSTPHTADIAVLDRLIETL